MEPSPIVSSARNRTAEPAILVIFGITGDLSQRKLLPALYHLVKNGLLHEQTRILGVTRGDTTTEDLLNQVNLCVNEAEGVCDNEAIQKVRDRLEMFKMDNTIGDEYDRLLGRLNSIENEVGMCMNRLYYLSIPPQIYAPIVRFLGEHHLNKSCQHGQAKTRVLVEKPFGFDLASAQALIQETGSQFTEEQIFRIDHYVAKETVQNILTFRFNNPIFNPIWNAESVSHIEITATEKLDIEGRATFYEQTGAMRDLIQSHLLQLLAITTMEPTALESDAIHASKLQLLNQIAPVATENITASAIRGQYTGYKDVVKNPASRIETYAAIKLYIQNQRWQHVPIIIRTGKALSEKLTEINVVFKPTREAPHHNRLTFRISPTEGIRLDLRVKKPGFDNEVQVADMDFSYERSFVDTHGHPDAYERVLVDAVLGDHTLFATGEEVLASWRIIQPIIEAWSSTDDGMESYVPGSWGPPSSEGFIQVAENSHDE